MALSLVYLRSGSFMISGTSSSLSIMISLMPALLLLLLSLSSGVVPVVVATSPSGLSPQEMQYIMDDHHNARRTLATPVANNMLKLIWDPLLAQVAQNYANGCTVDTFTHNDNRLTQYQALGGTHYNVPNFGAWINENWYSGPATNLTDQFFGGAVPAWTNVACSPGQVCTTCSEMNNFYGTPTAGGTPCSQSSVSGHYAQVMWAITQYVGCGYSDACGTVCDYGPGGLANAPDTLAPSDVWGVGGPAASNCPSYAPYNDLGLCSTVAPGTSPTSVPIITTQPTSATAAAAATTQQQPQPPTTTFPTSSRTTSASATTTVSTSAPKTTKVRTTAAASTTTTVAVTATTVQTPVLTNAPVTIAPQTSGISSLEIQYILDDHNTARRTLATPQANNMMEIMWDQKLAQVAQAYADTCNMNSYTPNDAATTQYQTLGGSTNAAEPGYGIVYVGENWYSGPPSNLTDSLLGGATRSWTTAACLAWSFAGSANTCNSPVCSEEQNFYQTGSVGGQSCNQQSASGSAYHFTQVMWATTQYVGCGYNAACGTVCNYGPGGNFNQPDGTQTAVDVWGVGGAPASACPASAPYNNLGLCSTHGTGSPSSSIATSRPVAAFTPATVPPVSSASAYVTLSFSQLSLTDAQSPSWQSSLLSQIAQAVSLADPSALSVYGVSLAPPSSSPASPSSSSSVLVALQVSARPLNAPRSALTLAGAVSTLVSMCVTHASLPLNGNAAMQFNPGNVDLMNTFPGLSATTQVTMTPPNDVTQQQQQTGGAGGGGGTSVTVIIIVAVVAAAVLALVAVAVGIWCVRRKQQAFQNTTAQMSSYSPASKV